MHPTITQPLSIAYLQQWQRSVKRGCSNFTFIEKYFDTNMGELTLNKMTETTLDQEKRAVHVAFALAIFTIVYNLAEGLIATWFGYQDETLALFGFGIDSFIEMISGLGIAYMVLRIQRNPTSHRSGFEKTALKITGGSFYILVFGLLLSAIITIIMGQKPVTTFWGVIISFVSIVVMFFLLQAKLRVGKQLHSEAILADASCTKVCIYMSCVLLASSGIYEWTGFAYADSIGTLGLAWFSYQEGKECFEKAASDKYCHH
jgi:divalent metal cation (Fe/Co/Zn/Cd) transporter